MYYKYFGLAGHPFRLIPDTRNFFHGGQRGAVLGALQYAITAGEGIVKVIGEVGSGKTMLCRTLVARLPLAVEVAYLANPSLSREEVLRAILQELGQVEAARAGDRLALLNALHHHLITLHGEGCRVVVFVEEAQGMPLETLEEIRFLSNLETRNGKLLQIVLFGQPELDVLLAQDKLRQLRDRITHSFYLRPLQAAEVRDYIRFRLDAAGAQGREFFTPAALRYLARHSGGLMRRIHVLADKALLAAYADRASRVRLRHLRRALRDDRPPAGSGRKLLQRLVPAGLGAAVTAVILGAYLFVQGGIPGAVSGPVFDPAFSPAVAAQSQADEADVPGQTVQAGPQDSLVARRLAATRAWLARGGQGYTVQVMLTDDDDRGALEDFLSQETLRPHLSRLFVYPTRLGGRDRWCVLYGGFASYQAALAAVAQVPAPFREFGPFVRSLRKVGQEVARYTGPLAHDMETEGT